MNLFRTLNFIANHKLNRHCRIQAILKYIRWQISSRLALGPVLVNLVEDVRMIAKPGMTAVTGNIYTGIEEFEDVMFALQQVIMRVRGARKVTINHIYPTTL